MKKFIYIFILICLISCDTPVVTFPPDDSFPLFDRVFADGLGDPTGVTSPTTKITFIFNKEMTGLQAEDIHMEASFPFFKGNLREIDKKTFELDIIPAKSGVIKAIIAPYTFGGWSVVSVQVFADYDFEIYFDRSMLVNCVRILKYNNIAKEVNIPKSISGFPVVTIFQNVFSAKKLTGVTIPDGVETIEMFTFNSNLLTSIIIPDSVVSIGSGAFADNKLDTITLSDNITAIGASAFGNNLLTSIIIPSEIVSLAGFDNNMLDNVDIPETVENIGISAFENNRLTEINFDKLKNLKSISNYAFAHNLIEDVDIPSAVTDISGFNNNLIEAVDLKENIISIGAYAFANNKIRDKLTLPGRTESIGRYAFANNKIKEIEFINGTNLKSIGEGAFQNNELERVIISGRTAIGEQAFTGNSIIEITLIEGVTLSGIVFGNGFEAVLKLNNNAAGKYTRDPITNIWTKEP